MCKYDEHMNNLQLKQADYLLKLVMAMYKSEGMSDELEQITRVRDVLSELQAPQVRAGDSMARDDSHLYLTAVMQHGDAVGILDIECHIFPPLVIEQQTTVGQHPIYIQYQ